MEENKDQIRFHRATPILYVGNLAESLEYYTEKLGFSLEWDYEDSFASISRMEADLMLCEGDQGHPGSWIYIGVGDADQLFEEFSNSGAHIGLPPTNYSWAREIHVLDPDDNVIRFGSDPRQDEPFSDWVYWYKK